MAFAPRFGFAAMCAVIATMAGLATFGVRSPEKGAKGPTLRLAMFPNLTHAPGLLVSHSGIPGYAVKTQFVNAGPEAVQALQTGAVDAAYLGPVPALNALERGMGIRILSGACEGGAGLVVRPDVGIRSVADLDGRSVAVPQLGGTQDVSLRKFLAEAGLRPSSLGGSVEVLPLKNADTLTMFKQGRLDAAWLPEPWISRLELEQHAVLVLDESKLWRLPSAILVVSERFASKHPEAVQALVDANRTAILRLRSEPAASKQIVLKTLASAGSKISPGVLERAWPRLAFTPEIDPASLEAMKTAARQAGYLPKPKVSP